MDLKRFSMLRRSGKVAVLCLVLALFAGSGWAAELPLRHQFETGYRQLLQQVDQGSRPETAAQQALQLRTALDHALVENQAAVETLKLELQGAPKGQRPDLADQLVAAGAARERTLQTYLGRLQALLGRPPVASAVKETKTGADMAKPEDQGVSLQFHSIPEDLSQGRVE